MKNLIYIITLNIIFISSNINAQIITDRPTQTESSSTIPKGSFQLESGISFQIAEENQISIQQFNIPNNLLKYGISKKIELRVVSQIESIKTNNKNLTGFSNLQIGTKIQLFKQKNNITQIAFITHLILPSGSKSLNNNKYGTYNKLSISHQIREKTSISYNIGYSNLGLENDFYTYSVCFGLSINDKMSIFIEPFGEIIDIDTHNTNIDTGFTYLFNKNFQFDFSFGSGINYNINFIGLGCSWLFNKKQ